MKRTALFIAIVLLFATGCQSREALLHNGSFTEGWEEGTAASGNAAVSDSGVFSGGVTASDATAVSNAEDDADISADPDAAAAAAVSNASATPDPAADPGTGKTGTGAKTDGEQELISDFDDFYKKWRPLKIRKHGDSTDYDASESLVYTIVDMISKVETVDIDTPEGKIQAESFDYGHYDYRLKFKGARDILFVREGNVFHFDGEKKLYVLWGSADPLWESLVFDTGNNTVDIDGEKIRVMARTYAEDQDGDGKAEDIGLVYERYKSDYGKGDLVLSVNGSKIAAAEGYGTDMFTSPYRTIMEMPEVRYLDEQDGKSKAVLVDYTWATNGVGSTGVVNAYRYVNGNMEEIKILDTERALKYKGGNIINVYYPAFEKSLDLKFDAGDLIGSFYKDEETFLQRLEGYGPHPLWYLVNDFNGDGRDDLCCVSFLLDYPVILCTEYSYYEYRDGVIKPVQVYAGPIGFDDEKTAYLKGYILDIVHFKGYLAVGENGITDEDFQPYREYTPDEIKAAAEGLQKDGILVRKGDRLYVRYQGMTGITKSE